MREGNRKTPAVIGGVFIAHYLVFDTFVQSSDPHLEDGFTPIPKVLRTTRQHPVGQGEGGYLETADRSGKWLVG